MEICLSNSIWNNMEKYNNILENASEYTLSKKQGKI